MTHDAFVLAVWLGFAHLLGDFVFQNDWMASNKRDPLRLSVHIVIVSALTALMIGPAHFDIIVVIAVSHMAIDLAKAWLDKDGTWQGFLADQAAHFLVIIIVAAAIPADISTLLAPTLLAPAFGPELPTKAAIVISGLIVAVRASGFLIALFVKRFPLDVQNGIKGMEKGGAVIGQLERFLAYVLIVSGNASAVGFLIAAKSILRFGDVTSDRDRKVAEYVIIGTLLSFLCAITTGIVTVMLLQ